MALLSEADVEGYHRDGYLAVTRLADDPDVEWLAHLCSALLASEAGRRDLAGPGPATLPQLLYPERREPKVLETSFFDRATSMGAQLMGRDDLDWFTHFIVKPASGGASTAWHQDVAVWDDVRFGARQAGTGSVRRKRAPEAPFSTVAVPPWAVAASRTMARPSPAPGFERAVAAR